MTENGFLIFLRAIEKIEKYSLNGYDAFIEDERTQVWIIHHLQMVGEACNHLSDSLTEKTSGYSLGRHSGLEKHSRAPVFRN